MRCGFDDDLAGQVTATSNRIRGLLTQIHPALERVLGPHLDHPAVVDLLQRYPAPPDLAKLGLTRLAHRLVKLAPRMGKRLAAELLQALSEQTVVVVGTNAASLVLPRLTKQLEDLRTQRAEIAVAVEWLVDAHLRQPVLTSMQGVGVRTAARLLTEVAGKSFASAGHLASYAGLAPVTRRSGYSIRGEHASRWWNKILKRALFLSAFAALRDPVSRSYYDRKRVQGKHLNQALITLARARCDVIRNAPRRHHVPAASSPCRLTRTMVPLRHRWRLRCGGGFVEERLLRLAFVLEHAQLGADDGEGLEIVAGLPSAAGLGLQLRVGGFVYQDDVARAGAMK